RFQSISQTSPIRRPRAPIQPSDWPARIATPPCPCLTFGFLKRRLLRGKSRTTTIGSQRALGKSRRFSCLHFLLFPLLFSFFFSSRFGSFLFLLLLLLLPFYSLLHAWCMYVTL
ncbi:hypothetical protein CCMA1212_008398, partial [Trichoderma ghanense]